MLSHLKIKLNVVPQSSHPPSLPVEIVTVITILLVVTLLKMCYRYRLQDVDVRKVLDVQLKLPNQSQTQKAHNIIK